MRIAVISEFSARDKNVHILEALGDIDAQVYNVGMTKDGTENELSYIHTGLMAGLSLASKAADFVIGGCGTGQGFAISAMQYPGVYCGLITNPLDAWLFSQINHGNCISLALNKGFGWAGDIQLSYIFEKLFTDIPGEGYPPHRSEPQRKSRAILQEINEITHKDFPSILRTIKPEIYTHIIQHKPFLDFIQNQAKENELRNMILNIDKQSLVPSA